MGAAASVLYRFPPERFGFYPRCPIHEYTGLLCPGCGGTRALAALLHGHLAEAMRRNGLVTVLLPVLLAWAAAAYRRAIVGKEYAWPRAPKLGVAALLLAAFAFMVARNLL